MREKPVVILLFVFSIVLITLFFMISPTFITDNGDVKHFEDNDIAFDMYDDWTVYEYDDPIKIPFLSTSPNTLLLNPVNSDKFNYSTESMDNSVSEGEVINTGTTNAFDVAIVKTEISKVDSLPEGVSLDNAYKADSLYPLMSNSGGFNLENDTALTVSGKPAHQFVYIVSGMTYHDTWIENNGKYIRVLSQVSSGFADDVFPQFDYLIQTFKIK